MADAPLMYKGLLGRSGSWVWVVPGSVSFPSILKDRKWPLHSSLIFHDLLGYLCATMANYPLIFGISLAINVAVTFRSSDKFKLYCGSSPRNQEDPHNKHEDEPLLEKGASASDAGDGGKATEKARHAALLRRYLAVYLLAALSDWLQGPYV